MLKGISPLISPELLSIMARMGHSDELVPADAHFPAETYNLRVIRADGLQIADLLRATLPLFELDSYVQHPLTMMAAVHGDTLDTEVEALYHKSIRITNPNVPDIEMIDRFDFYNRTKNAYAVVLTGETAKYGNIILKKGVTPV